MRESQFAERAAQNGNEPRCMRPKPLPTNAERVSCTSHTWAAHSSNVAETSVRHVSLLMGPCSVPGQPHTHSAELPVKRKDNETITSEGSST